MPELKPCPFCGNEAEMESRYIGYGSLGLGAHDWYTVKCKSCRGKSDEYGTEEAAIAAWNKRVKEGEE
jgi:Lar family restriction alleviation protein